jgi:hypothetical protein
VLVEDMAKTQHVLLGPQFRVVPGCLHEKGGAPVAGPASQAAIVSGHAVEGGSQPARIAIPQPPLQMLRIHGDGFFDRVRPGLAEASQLLRIRFWEALYQLLQPPTFLSLLLVAGWLLQGGGSRAEGCHRRPYTEYPTARSIPPLL